MEIVAEAGGTRVAAAGGTRATEAGGSAQVPGDAAAEALALLENGHAGAAERLAREALAEAPEEPALLALLGRALLRQGRAEEAIPPLLGALQAAPTDPGLWQWLVEALAETDRLAPARQALAQGVAFGLSRAAAGALEIMLRLREQHGPPRLAGAEEEGPPPGRVAAARPAPPPGLVAESREMLALYEKELYEAVAERARAAVARWPDHVAGHEFLAAALEALRRFEEAVEPARRVVRFLPEDMAARLRLDRMIAGRATQRARAGRPDPFGTLTLPPEADGARAAWQRAARMQLQGKVELAAAAYEEADRLVPGVAEIKHNLAAMLQACGRLDEASAQLARAAELKPDSLYVRQAHAGLLLNRALYGEAAEAYRAALGIDPDNGETLLGLATALRAIGKLAEAEAAARQAIEGGERTGVAYSTLGHVMQLQGRTEEARALFRQAIEIDPDNHHAGSGLLFCEVHSGAGTAEESFALHRAFGQRVEAMVEPFRHDRALRRHAGPPRLGFVSGDLRAHAVSHFIEPFLRDLSNRGFELHAYMTAPKEDHISDKLRPIFRSWAQVNAMHEPDLARRILDDRVDILVDLSGHTAHHRLGVFAHRPAPVQASWIGYPGTTGLSRIDYFLCNGVLAPDGVLDGQMTEKLVRLPFSTVFDPFREDPDVAPLPALANGRITFGSFNRIAKVTDAAISLWARILHAVPTSRLMVAAIPEEAARLRVRDAFAAHGIGEDRLILRWRVGFESYLRQHDEIDVMLDTFPYAGGTSTCFAAWMGVPTLTLMGGTMQARVGASLMAHLGLHGFVAESEEDYLARAVAWAGAVERLAMLRAGMRRRVMTRLADPRRVVDGLEVALHLMWQRWCHGLPAEPFHVALDEGSILDLPPDSPGAVAPFPLSREAA